MPNISIIKPPTTAKSSGFHFTAWNLPNKSATLWLWMFEWLRNLIWHNSSGQSANPPATSHPEPLLQIHFRLSAEIIGQPSANVLARLPRQLIGPREFPRDIGANYIKSPAVLPRFAYGTIVERLTDLVKHFHCFDAWSILLPHRDGKKTYIAFKNSRRKPNLVPQERLLSPRQLLSMARGLHMKSGVRLLCAPRRRWFAS